VRIGVLAVQGAFIEHIQLLKKLGVKAIEVRQLEDFHNLDGLILPGGESTTQARLLHDLGLFEPIKHSIVNGLPILATCAGAILLAQTIDDDPTHHFQTFPMTIKRNFYGRQSGSFSHAFSIDQKRIQLTFIRAPLITSVGEGVSVMFRLNEGVVACQFHNQIALTFHPELTGEPIFHHQFLALVNANMREKNKKLEV
jgi:5'-phosphate synthase pdxT subunit